MCARNSKSLVHVHARTHRVVQQGVFFIQRKKNDNRIPALHHSTCFRNGKLQSRARAHTRGKDTQVGKRFFFYFFALLLQRAGVAGDVRTRRVYIFGILYERHRVAHAQTRGSSLNSVQHEMCFSFILQLLLSLSLYIHTIYINIRIHILILMCSLYRIFLRVE